MKIYVLSYCQNKYQEQRVAKFVQGNGGEIINPDFGQRGKDGHLTTIDFKFLVHKADQIWIILSGFNYDVFELEQKIKQLKLCRYFKINQDGRYIGKVKEVERNFFRPKGLIGGTKF